MGPGMHSLQVLGSLNSFISKGTEAGRDRYRYRTPLLDWGVKKKDEEPTQSVACPAYRTEDGANSTTRTRAPSHRPRTKTEIRWRSHFAGPS